ncbi:cytochrome P450 [Micromonospora echinaurantiaca]|uniref:cytochrome P450 n=1 Tax=Micromonospora echinaurantiaca TaxID=47857 RepID=UPI00379C3ACA
MSGTAVRAAALFDPTDPAIADDPYPSYARLRRKAPVLHLPAADVWAVSRHADVAAVLRDPATFSSKVGMSPDFGGRKVIPDAGVRYRIGAPDVRVLIATDPPEHQVFRRAVARAFSPSAVAALAPGVTRIARDRVRRLLAYDGPVDFFAEVAEPVPALVLAEMLGVPAEMQHEFRQWSAVITADLSQAGSGADGIGRGMDMFRFFGRRLRHGTPHDPPDLFDAIAAGRRAGITDQEVLAFCAFLLVAGIETTTSLATNLLHTLIGQPELADRLRRHPELVPAAVEEGIRYDTSVQALWRGTTREVTLRGQRIPAGARVLVLFGSANRDETVFTDPDTFRLDRHPNDHLSFGGGVHYCLGARLARLELTAVFTELLAATRAIEAAGPGRRTGSLVLRGFTHQPVRVVPR